MDTPSTTEADHPPMLSLTETAAMLRCHPNTVRAWVRQGKLAAIPMGPEKVNMYLKADVERLKKPLERAGVIVKEDKHAFPVVGIGASAGGLDAMSRLLAHLPTDLGLAYVFVTHQEKDQEKTLSGLLRKKTAIPVLVVENGMKLAPDHLYVTPAGMHSAVINGTFTLQVPRGVNGRALRPIDAFFTALANEYQNNAIGIVLSGGGMDGTEGLRAIKAEDGLTIVQDGSAQDKGMPESALEAGVVDLVRAPEEIGPELAQLIKELYPGGKARIPSKHENELRRILQYMLEQRGVDFSEYKESTIHRRIIRRMVLSKCRKLSDYSALLRGIPSELDTLYSDLLINVTSFFRDPAFHKALTERVLPELFKDRPATDTLRIWVPACAGGEEVVSIAITLLEFLGEQAMNTPVQIFATDLNERTIEKARMGIYKKSALQDMAPERVAKYFMHVDGHYQVIKPIRDMCVFAKHDLLKDPPFSRVDLISCQNVLIYLEGPAQGRILKSFHYALKPTGFLVLGRSETPANAGDIFVQPEREHKVYCKKRRGSGRLELDLRFKPAPISQPTNGSRPATPRLSGPRGDMDREMEQLLLHRYVPASVLVNKDLDIVRFLGSTAPFLSPRTGRASLSLLKMVRDDLAFELRAMLLKARKKNIPVCKSGIPIRLNSGLQDVSIDVLPLGGTRDPHYLVLFKEERLALSTVMPAGKGDPGKRAIEVRDKRIAQLEQELRDAREQVRLVSEESEITLQELQASNEEVVSSNEELQSINEELETSKEELQSINEEFATINEELQQRNDALRESQERLELATRTGKMGIWDWDVPADRITWSDSLFEIHGVKPGAFDASAKGFARLVHPEDRQQVAEAMDRALKLGAHYEVEFRAVRPDGDVIWLFTNASVLRVDGRPVRMLGATLDITDRKAAELALERRTRALELMNAMGDTLIAELDTEKIVQAVTDTAREVSGASFGAFFYNVTNVEGKSYMLYTLSGLPRETFAEFPMPRATDLFGPTFRGEGAIRIDDVRLDPRFGHKAPHYGMPKGHPPVCSYLAVPVTSRDGKVLGGLFFGHPEPGRFTREAEEMVTTLAAQAALAIDNADLHAAVQRELEHQQQAGEALQVSEEKFRLLAENMDQLAWMAEADGSAMWFNDRWEQFSGIPLAEIRERAPTDLHHPDHYDRVTASLVASAEKGESWEETFPLKAKDGSWRWFLSRAVPVRNADGLVYRWFGTSTDITEQRKVQEDLRESEERYRKLIATLPAAVYTCDATGRILIHNEACTALWGEAPDTSAGMWHGAHRLYTKEGEPIAKENSPMFRAMKEGRSVREEVIVERKDGTRRHALVHPEPLFDSTGSVVGGYNVLVDITDLKENQRALVLSEERFKAVFQHSPFGIVLADGDGRMVDVNPAFASMIGLLREELVGRTSVELDIVTDTRTRNKLLDALHSTGHTRDAEVEMMRRDGSKLLVRSNAEVVMLDEERYIIGMVEDITERHRAESERQQLSGMLERSLNEIYIFDLESLRFEYVNHGALSNLGYTLEQMRGMTPVDIKPELDARQFDALVRPLRNGEKGKLLFYTVHRRANGSDYPVEVHLQIVNNGPKPLFMAMILDITERKLGEERLRVVTETGKLGIWDWDIVADSITWTDPVYGIHGVAKGAFEPTMAGYAELIHPEDRARVSAAIKKSLEEDAPYEIEFRARNAEGAVNWVFTSGVVIRTDGRPVRMMGGTMNITRRKVAEEAARRLAAIVESSDDAIISKDLGGLITSWNMGAERMFGYPAEEIIGMPNTVLFPEDRREEESALFERLKKGERIEHYDTVRLRKDGSRVEVSLSLSPMKNEMGEIIGASKTIRDISESKRAQEAVRASEARFHLLADNVKQLIWMAPADGSSMWFNKRWHEFTGMTGEQIRMDAKSLHHPDHYDRAINSLRECAAKGEPWEDTFPLKGKDGKYHWFLATAMPVHNAEGKVVRWFGTCTDITTAREAQALIYENEERFRMLADNMSQMAYVADADGRITWVNRRWTDYTGMGVEEMNDGGWGKAVDPAHFDDMVASYSIAQQKGEPWEYVFRVKSTTGEYRWFLSRSVPILGEDGKVERWFGTNTDITAQKLAEEALEESAKHKDHFLATLAHELRNPLAPLKNGLQLMELAPDDPQLLETTREMMVRQLDHMVRLVDDLMDLSRISRGKIDLQKEDMALHHAVSMAMEASKPLIDRNRHHLEVILQEANLVVHGDVARLTQVVSNLLNNAAKYTAPGGRIELNMRKEGDQAVISVKDNGIGISPDAMPRVFDMFTQVDPHINNNATGGLGIGLNVVQRLVRMHHGDVEGRSEGLGKGSEFIVRLPLVATTEKPKDGEMVKETLAALSKRRVLVVDDNEDIALSMSMILKKIGHTVAVANDGEHAVAMAESFRPDVILMDIGMPRMNGYEACATIRKTEHGKRIHIIAVSGWGQEEDRKKSQDAGFDGHVVKPMEKATLERVIAEAKPHVGA